MKNAQDVPLTIAVLDIYGFEIFDRNGFEQVREEARESERERRERKKERKKEKKRDI